MSKVPNGWAFSRVGDACTIRNNLRFPINSDERESIKGCFPYFGPTGILSFINDYKIDDNFALIGEDGDHFLKFKEKEMTLFFSGKANVNNHAHIICDSILCKARWFYFSFMHADITSHLTRQGAKRYKLTKASLEKLPILIPPLPEQIKIAEILSTWDNAINTVQKLLANSQQQKKSLMQQLLTGKKRFAGFEGEWEDTKLDDLFSFKRGKGLSKDELFSTGKYKCVLYGELYTKYDEVIKTVISRTNATESVKSIFGDILIPSSTTTTGIDLAKAVAILEDDVFLGGDINILRRKNSSLCSVFMAYLLTHIKKYEIAAYAQGITIIHLYGSDIKKIRVSIPSLPEQQKIAAVLTTSDQEIDNLRAQLNQLKQEKKALMQQLLTGKRRVKVEEAA